MFSRHSKRRKKFREKGEDRKKYVNRFVIRLKCNMARVRLDPGLNLIF